MNKTYNTDVIDNKVNKEAGKGLSTNDYTTIEKNKLAGLSNYDDTILANKVIGIETALPNKLEQSDIDGLVSGMSYSNATGILTITKEDNTTFNINLPLESFVQSGRYDGATESLILVLTDGTEISIPVSALISEYTADGVTLELDTTTNTFKVKQSVIDTINGKADTSSLSTVATSNDYNDLDNLPTIPTKTSEITNDSGYITNTVTDLANYTPTTTINTLLDGKVNIAQGVANAGKILTVGSTGDVELVENSTPELEVENIYWTDDTSTVYTMDKNTIGTNADSEWKIIVPSDGSVQTSHNPIIIQNEVKDGTTINCTNMYGMANTDIYIKKELQASDFNAIDEEFFSIDLKIDADVCFFEFVKNGDVWKFGISKDIDTGFLIATRGNKTYPLKGGGYPYINGFQEYHNVSFKRKGTLLTVYINGIVIFNETSVDNGTTDSYISIRKQSYSQQYLILNISSGKLVIPNASVSTNLVITKPITNLYLGLRSIGSSLASFSITDIQPTALVEGAKINMFYECGTRATIKNITINGIQCLNALSLIPSANKSGVVELVLEDIATKNYICDYNDGLYGIKDYEAFIIGAGENKVSINQGSANKGKTLRVDSFGDLYLVDNRSFQGINGYTIFPSEFVATTSIPGYVAKIVYLDDRIKERHLPIICFDNSVKEEFNSVVYTYNGYMEIYFSKVLTSSVGIESIAFIYTENS